MTYAESVADMNTEEYERILDEARIYNAELAERRIQHSQHVVRPQGSSFSKVVYRLGQA